MGWLAVAAAPPALAALQPEMKFHFFTSPCQAPGSSGSTATMELTLCQSLFGTNLLALHLQIFTVLGQSFPLTTGLGCSAGLALPGSLSLPGQALPLAGLISLQTCWIGRYFSLSGTNPAQSPAFSKCVSRVGAALKCLSPSAVFVWVAGPAGAVW